MYILAFESSCDDTSVALLDDANLVSLHTHTQTEHTMTQGVVPEVAARLHSDVIFSLTQKVLDEGNVQLKDIQAYACTESPGLIPSLLVGKTVAKMFAQMYAKPLVWVNHIEAHVFSVFLDRTQQDIQFPAVVLSASGGHNDLFYWENTQTLIKIGGTRDDSAGESMDKVGRELGLPFPAGRCIDERSMKYGVGSMNGKKLFPIPLLEEDSLDFSFSGLKSSAFREINKRKEASGGLTEKDIDEICFEYQESVMRTLVEKLFRAVSRYQVSHVYLVGGVSANSRLRSMIQSKILEEGMTFLTPKKHIYCADNAAMIGITAWYKHLQRGV